ncbi:EAL domain-containing protein [Halolactibacillus sp. JCM 19043]|uniref:EAL domain-containing protein n=1 Tax=Halolactibacillus sp. JCM 19043 TaxID=1460638 RepID=UPI000783B53F|nr:EAL domain-containing protein [Halolactibacillus sp. JCM 19043]
MPCPHCTIVGHKITFSLDRERIDLIKNHFTQHNFPMDIEEDQLTTHEQGARELVDFLLAMDLATDVTFKINSYDWLPLSDFKDYQDASWVDELLFEPFIQMHFQPIIKSNGEIFAYEMLSRFVDRQGKKIFPDVMFPAAKTRGRTFALDRICRINAVRHVKRLLPNQKGFINFIPTAIYLPEFCLKTTTDLAHALDIDSSRFVFEVVETEQVKDTAHLQSILKYYQDNGFQYALDDVGSGYNTLNFLKELKPPYIKLDLTFVRDVNRDLDKQRIAKEILKMRDQFDAMALAEGVETIEEFNWLKQAGFDLFQGYLFGKPESEPLTTPSIDLTSL